MKVLDFGVAKALASVERQESGGAPDTETGALVGTIGYMSPEQLLGDSPDVSWDVWALTVMAYEYLAGRLPFPVESRESWRRLVLAGRHTPLTAHLADPPQRWQSFFDAAFSPDRTPRPRSAAEFFRQLEQAFG